MIHRIIAVFVLLCAALDMPAQKRFPWRPAPPTVAFSCSVSPTQAARRITTTDYPLVTDTPGAGTQRAIPAWGSGPFCDEVFGAEMLRVSRDVGTKTGQLGHLGFNSDDTRLALACGGGVCIYSINPSTMTLAPSPAPQALSLGFDAGGSLAIASPDNTFWSMRAGEEKIIYTLYGLQVIRINVDGTPDVFGKLPSTVAWDFTSRITVPGVTGLYFNRCSPDSTTTRIATGLAYPAGAAIGYFVFDLGTGATVVKFLNGVDSPDGIATASLSGWQQVTLPRSSVVGGGSITVTLYNGSQNGYKPNIDRTGNYLLFPRTGVIAPTTGDLSTDDAPANSHIVRKIGGGGWTWKILHELGHSGVGPGQMLGHDVTGQKLRVWDFETMTTWGDRTGVNANLGTEIFNFAKNFQVDYTTWNLTGPAITSYTCARPTNPFWGPPQSYDCTGIAANELVAWKPDGTYRRFAKTYVYSDGLNPGATFTSPLVVFPMQPVRSTSGGLVIFVTNFNNTTSPNDYHVFMARVPSF